MNTNNRLPMVVLLCCLLLSLTLKSSGQAPSKPAAPPPSKPMPPPEDDPPPPMPPADKKDDPMPPAGGMGKGQPGASHPGPPKQMPKGPPMPPPQPTIPTGPPATSKGPFPGYPKKGAEEPSQTLDPAVKMEDSYEGGALIVRQQAEKPFSIHTGESIFYRLEIEVTKAVILDLTAIKQGVLGGLNGSDFRYFDEHKPDVKVSTTVRGDKTIWVVELRLQTFQFVPKNVSTTTFQRKLPLVLAFQYATEKIGGYPAWKRLETKPYVFTWVPTADENPNLIEGNLNPAPMPKSNWRTATTAIATFLVALPVAALLLVVLHNRARKRSANSRETAWARITQISDRAGDSLDQSLAGELRTVLANFIGSLADTDEELLAKIDGTRRPALQAVLRVIGRLRARATGTRLSPTDTQGLFVQIRVVVGVR